MALQAYDIIMDENKALRKYSEQEVTEDPLLVLACSHVLRMTSMDGYMELPSAYTTDKHGKWSKPCQMKVQMAAAASKCLLTLDTSKFTFCMMGSVPSGLHISPVESHAVKPTKLHTQAPVQ